MSRSFTGVYKFTADWCGPCQSIKERLKQAVQDILGDPKRLRDVDVDQQPDVATEFGVTAMPTLVFVIDGVEQADLRVQGAQMSTIESNLRAFAERMPAENQNELPTLREATVQCQAPSSSRSSRNPK